MFTTPGFSRAVALGSVMGLVAAVALAAPARAAAGDLDPTFGGDGVVTLEIGDPAGAEGAADLVVLGDGTIFAVGSAGFETHPPVLRTYLLSPTGEPLTPAGGIGPRDGSALRAVARAPGGKVVAVGWAGTFAYEGPLIRSWFLVARFLPNGAPDPSFSGDGFALTAMGAGDAFANDVAVRPDGRIVVTGAATRNGAGVFAAARYTAAGALDPTFGTNGRSFVTFAAGNAEAEAVGIGPDGGVVIAGTSVLPSDGRPSFAVARLRSNGTLDARFSGDGRTIVTFSTRRATAHDVGVMADGRIVVGGVVSSLTGDLFGLARLRTGGGLDTTFDADGKVLTRFTSGDATLWALTLVPGGTIVAAGGADYDLALARYSPNGMLDATFGGDGMVTTDQPDPSAFRGVALMPDGKIMAAGNTGNEPAFARYLA
ncbi:MAG TPA: hypothetical protein VF235_00105 [Actinomycetota bacterium]